MQQLSRVIDHTLLKSEATPFSIAKFAEEAQQHFLCSLCELTVGTRMLRRLKTDQPEKKFHVCSSRRFPGAMATEMKAAETAWCVQQERMKLIWWFLIGDLKDKPNQLFNRYCKALSRRPRGKVVKVILETQFINRTRKHSVCWQTSGAHFCQNKHRIFRWRSNLRWCATDEKYCGR